MKWCRFQHEPFGDRAVWATNAIRMAKMNWRATATMQKAIDVAHRAMQQTPIADAVIADECRKAGVAWINLLERSPSGRLLRRYADTRHAIYARLIDAGLSTPEIGRLFATSHTTVLTLIGGTDAPVRPAKR